MEVALSIVGVLLTVVTFYFSFFRKSTDELDNFKAQFRATQQISKLTQAKLEEYVNETACWDEAMFPGVSFKVYLEHMKDSYQQNLSDELFERVTTLELNKANIGSMLKSLEDQQSALLQIKAEIEIKLRQYRSSHSR